VGRKPSLLRRLAASTGSLDAEELTADLAENRFVKPCAGLAEGDKVEVLGRIRSVAYTPRESVPTLEAELFDGTGTVSLVWLGRRRIAGIEPGRTLLAAGRVGDHDGRPAMYNPRYELRAPQ
jgi:RecG-like helicase